LTPISGVGGQISGWLRAGGPSSPESSTNEIPGASVRRSDIIQRSGHSGRLIAVGLDKINGPRMDPRHNVQPRAGMRDHTSAAEQYHHQPTRQECLLDGSSGIAPRTAGRIGQTGPAVEGRPGYHRHPSAGGGGAVFAVAG
jgi:hypothetical protein